MLEPVADAEAVAQRRRQKAAAGRRPDQRERRQRQGHGARAGALAEDHRKPRILHRRVEGLLDGAAEAVDLVDEEDAARLQRGEKSRHVGLALQRRPGGLHQRDPELGGDDAGERRLAETRRPGKQHVVEGLAAALCRLDEDRELLGDLLLVDEVGQGRRAQRAVELLVTAAGAGVVDADLGVVGRQRVGSGGADPRAVDLGKLAHAVDLASPARRSASAISSSGSSLSASPSSCLGLGGRIAEVDEAVAGQRPRVAALLGAGRDRLLELPGDLLAQLDDDPLGGPLADSRHGLKALRVAGGDRPQQLARGAAAEHRDRHLGADPADRDQLPEEVALLLGGEPVQRQRVVAGDQLRVQESLPAGSRNRLQGLGGDREPVADPTGVDDDVVRAANQDLTPNGGDHPLRLSA